MTVYRLLWKPSALKELKKLSSPLISRILKAVEDLAGNPFPSGSRKLVGGEGSYRIRVGDYRVVYSVFEHQMIIEIIRVKHRKDVYR